MQNNKRSKTETLRDPKREREIKNRYTKIDKVGGSGTYSCSIIVGGQKFRFGPYCDKRSEADWFCDMMAIAIHTIIKESQHETA